MTHNEQSYGSNFYRSDYQIYEEGMTYTTENSSYNESYGADEAAQYHFYNQQWSNVSDLDNIDVASLRELSVSMGRKKYIKNMSQGQDNADSGASKRRPKDKCKAMHSTVLAALSKFSLWRHTLIRMEMRYGTSIMAYFEFIKWLMLLNLCAFISVLGFLVVPTFFDDKHRVQTTEEFGLNTIMDLFQGTGILENTLLFYGYYSNETLKYTIGNQAMYYNLPLVYILLYLSYLLTCLLVISKLSVRQFKENLSIADSAYSNLVFGRWTFSIQHPSYAEKKHRAIYAEITSTLSLNTLEENRKQKFIDNKNKIIALRVIINTVDVAILIAGAFAVYIAFEQSQSHINDNQDDMLYTLFYQFLPSVTIVLLNKIVPIVFQLLIKFEVYSETFAIKLTLFRMVFLRMFSLCVLYASLYAQVVDNKRTYVCWETHVGQEMYKLALTEFLVHVLSTLILGFVLYKLSKYISFLANSAFDLPKNVLDLVFLQTVSWFGGFYSPLLPFVFTIIFCFMFYIKKFACSITTGPNVVIFQTSHSKSTFMTVLLISLGFAGLPVILSIGEIAPSDSCGPFSGQKIAWHIIPEAIRAIPAWTQDIFYVLESVPFVVPLFFVLCLMLYYYTAMLSTNDLMIKDMRKELSDLRSGKQHLKKIFKQFER